MTVIYGAIHREIQNHLWKNPGKTSIFKEISISTQFLIRLISGLTLRRNMKFFNETWRRICWGM